MKTNLIFYCLLSVAAAGLSAPELHAAPGDLDSLDPQIPPWQPPTPTVVYVSAVQRDGKIIIGGSFPSLLGAISLGRLNNDGTLDAGFDLNLPVSAIVYSVALQPDGKVLVAGQDIRPGRSLARFNVDGLLDQSFDPNPNGNVFAITVQSDGKIVFGGSFTTVQPNGASTATTRNNLARVNPDGTLDAGFDPNPNGGVVTIAVQSDGKILLGGSFRALQPNGAAIATTRNYVARVDADGTLDMGFDPNPDYGPFNPPGSVRSVAVQADGKVLLAGEFISLQANGAATATPRHYVARVNADGTLDAGFDPSPNYFPESIAPLADGTMLLGGGFTAFQPNGGAAQLSSFIARINPDGTLDTAFNPNPNGIVYSIAVQADGGVLIGGEFTTLQPNGASTATPRNFFARVQGYPVPLPTLSISALPRGRYELLWHRAGGTPELTRATFELSLDGGATFGRPVAANRVGTSADWESLLLSLSGSGVWRARGYAAGGEDNSSTSIIEQLLPFGPDTRTAIPGLFNTGVDSAGTPLGLYDPDYHYSMPGSGPLQPAPIAVTAAGGFPIPPWVDYANPVSTWISPITLSQSSPGLWVYKTTFDLSGKDPATAIITGRWAVDNTGEILLNGVSTGVTSSDYGVFTPFQITQGFQCGINTLTFNVNNAGTTPNPTGLRVEMTGLVSYLCVPTAPTGVSASDGTDCTHVLVSWNASCGDPQYYLVYRDGSLIGNSFTLSLTDTPGDKSPHAYTVRAVNNCGTSSASAADNGYAAGPPAAPTGVSATAGTYCGVVRVSWTASAGATSYDIYRDGSYLTTVSASPYDDIPGDFANHPYSVRANNGCGASGLSGSVIGNEGNCAHLLVDNADGGPYVQPVGGWSNSTSSAGYWATDYTHDGNVNKGSKSYTFIPTIQTAGAYEVFIWYTAGANRAGNVPVDIIYSGGTTTVSVNQQVNGSQWVSLGVRNFAAGRAGRVVVRNAGTTSYVIADAIKLVAAAPVAHLLVDDADGPTYFQTAGTWTPSTSSPGFWASDYLHDGNTGKGSKTATFIPSVATAGAYQVYIYYTSGPNRASNLPVDIFYNGGTATATVNERINGSTWVLLGTYNFAAGNSGHVTLRTTATDGYVIADAVRLVAAPPASHLVVDNADGAAYVQTVGSWTSSTASLGYWGTDYLHDANTGKGTKTVTFTPVVPTAGNYQVFIWYTAAANRASNVPVDIVHNGITTPVTVNEQTGGSAWVSLGTYNFAAGNSGHVTIGTAGTGGYVIADAIKLQ